MENLWSWTLSVCLALSPGQHQCARGHRIWITSPGLYRSESACEADWQAHVRALKARPGWDRLIVDGILCGWGYVEDRADPFWDLRQENLSP